MNNFEHLLKSRRKLKSKIKKTKDKVLKENLNVEIKKIDILINKNFIKIGC